MKLKQQADDALRQIYSDYADGLLRYCTVKLSGRDTAKDCVQECFVILYQRLLTGETIENPAAFLYSTAGNLLKSQWRRDKKEQKLLSIDEVAEYAAVEENASFADLDYDRCALELIATLDEDEQNIYRLRYMDKMSLQQIADGLGLSFYAAAMRLSRVRAKVKTLAGVWLEGDDSR